MKKIIGEYNGYELENGKKYRLVEESSNNYKVVEIIENKEIEVGIKFTKVKEYKEWIKSIDK